MDFFIKIKSLYDKYEDFNMLECKKLNYNEIIETYNDIFDDKNNKKINLLSIKYFYNLYPKFNILFYKLYYNIFLLKTK
jgi:hypothetical protein